jgi:hypothetical protein
VRRCPRRCLRRAHGCASLSGTPAFQRVCTIRPSGDAWHSDEPFTQVVTEVPCFESTLIASGECTVKLTVELPGMRQDLSLKIRQAPACSSFKLVGGNASWLG